MMSASMEERTQGALMAPPRRGMTAILVTSDATFSRRHGTAEKLERRGVYVVKTCDPSRLSVDAARNVDMVVSIIGQLRSRAASMQQIESTATAADVPHYSLPAQVTAPAWQQMADDVAAEGHEMDDLREDVASWASAPESRQASTPDAQPASVPDAPVSGTQAAPTDDDSAIARLYLEDAERAKGEAAEAVARLAVAERELEAEREKAAESLSHARRARNDAQVLADQLAADLAAARRSESDLREQITRLEASAEESRIMAEAAVTNGSVTAQHARHDEDSASLRSLLAGMRDLRAQLRHVDDSLSYTLGAVDALTREVASLRGTVGVHLAIANAQPRPDPPRAAVYPAAVVPVVPPEPETAPVLEPAPAPTKPRVVAARPAAPAPVEPKRRVVTPPGVMRDRAIAYVAAHPGTGVTAAAEALGLSSGYVSRMLLNLAGQGALAFIRDRRPCTYRVPEAKPAVAKAAVAKPKPKAVRTIQRRTQRQSRRALIARYVAAHPGCVGPDIEGALGLGSGAVYSHLRQMAEEGTIVRDNSQSPWRWSAVR